MATPFAGQIEGAAVWTVPGWLLGQMTVRPVAQMLMGIGFGAALLSAPAIVLYFVLPLGFVAIGQVKTLDFPCAKWLDGAQMLAPMSEHALNATEWRMPRRRLPCGCCSFRWRLACGGSLAAR